MHELEVLVIVVLAVEHGHVDQQVLHGLAAFLPSLDLLKVTVELVAFGLDGLSHMRHCIPIAIKGHLRVLTIPHRLMELCFDPISVPTVGLFGANDGVVCDKLPCVAVALVLLGLPPLAFCAILPHLLDLRTSRKLSFYVSLFVAHQLAMRHKNYFCMRHRKSHFCGAPDHMRHIKSHFCGALEQVRHRKSHFCGALQVRHRNYFFFPHP